MFKSKEKYIKNFDSEEAKILIEETEIFLEECVETIRTGTEELLGKTFGMTYEEKRYLLNIKENEQLECLVENRENGKRLFLIQSGLSNPKVKVNTFAIFNYFDGWGWIPRKEVIKFSNILKKLQDIHDIYYQRRYTKIETSRFEKRLNEKRKTESQKEQMEEYQYAYEKVKNKLDMKR